MLDGLPNGNYVWHLSGPLGLTDFAGNRLTANDPNGDYVVPFTVAATIRGIDGDPLQRTSQEPHDDPAQPQELGVLFPHELQAGITVTRDSMTREGSQPDSADGYRFEVLQSLFYFFRLTGTGIPAGVAISLSNKEGQVVPAASTQGGTTVKALLDPGIYVVRIGQWLAAESAQIGYQLHLTASSNNDNPPALTSGPTSALQLRLAGTTSPPADVPQVVIAGGSTGIVLTSGSTSDRSASPASFQIPLTSLTAFGQNFVGGVGLSLSGVTPPSSDRVVLRLPDWFDWPRQRELTELISSQSLRDLKPSRDDDAATDQEFLPSPPEENSSTKSEIEAAADPVPVNQSSLNKEGQRRAANKTLLPTDQEADEPPATKPEPAVSSADWKWFTTIAAVVSGSMSGDEAFGGKLQKMINRTRSPRKQPTIG